MLIIFISFHDGHIGPPTGKHILDFGQIHVYLFVHSVLFLLFWKFLEVVCVPTIVEFIWIVD